MKDLIIMILITLTGITVSIILFGKNQKAEFIYPGSKSSVSCYSKDVNNKIKLDSFDIKQTKVEAIQFAVAKLITGQFEFCKIAEVSP